MKRKAAFHLTPPAAEQRQTLAANGKAKAATSQTIKGPKPKKKQPVPEGAIWWLSQPCHPVIKKLGLVVFRERAERGWSVRELATAAKVGVATVFDVEQGEIITRVEILLRLETAFGMKKNELMDLAHQLLAAGG